MMCVVETYLHLIHQWKHKVYWRVSVYHHCLPILRGTYLLLPMVNFACRLLRKRHEAAKDIAWIK